MKKFVIICFFFVSALVTQGQSLILTGNIRLPGIDSVELNLPFDENSYYEGVRGIRTNGVFQKPDSNGNFRFVIGGDRPRFAVFMFSANGGNAHYRQDILLIPGQPLHIDVDTAIARRFVRYDANMKPNGYSDYDYFLKFSGKGKAGNELARNLLHGGGAFTMNRLEEGQFMYWSMDSLKRILLPILMHGLDSCKQLVYEARLPKNTTRAILLELSSKYAVSVFIDFAGWMHYKRKDTPGSYCFPLQDTILSIFGVPSDKDLELGCFFTHEYLRLYMSYRNLRINYAFENDPDSVHARRVLEDIMHGTPYEKFARIKSQSLPGYGDYYYELLLDKYLMSSKVWEKLLEDKCSGWIRAKNPPMALQYKQALEENFPKSPRLADLNREFLGMQKARLENTASADLRILTCSANASLKEILGPFAGKIIYLDIWGTWCGPCKAQMEFTPQLKTHYKNNKDIVFFYLDMDEDKDSARWRDYITIAHLTGEHLRMTSDRIQKLLDEIGGIKGYPTYCIFNRQGNLVVKDAKKPSDGEFLYDQLDEALDNK